MLEGKHMVKGKWSREEVELLKQLYSQRSNPDLSEVFQRPAAAVRSKAYRLHLTKAMGSPLAVVSSPGLE